MMKHNLLLISIWSILSLVRCQKICSREGSRIVRDYFTKALIPIFEKQHVPIPLECVLSPMRDLYYPQELHKARVGHEKWLCKYCNKTFYSEFYLDLHFVNRHNETLIVNEQSVCLADYCSIFRCDVLKRPKRSLRSLNPLARGPMMTTRRSKKSLNEQQLTILRTRCAALINQCIPRNIIHDTRMKLQSEHHDSFNFPVDQMYTVLCAYLTVNKYYELPAYRKPLISFTSIFCAVVFLGMCLVGIGVVTHSDWKFDDGEDSDSDKHLSADSISTATALLSTTPTNGIMHSSSKTQTSSVRHRVRFKSAECESQPHHHT